MPPIDFWLGLVVGVTGLSLAILSTSLWQLSRGWQVLNQQEIRLLNPERWLAKGFQSQAELEAQAQALFSEPLVSILVCFHAEDPAQQDILPALQAQTYPRLEFVLVADRATPQLLQVLRQFVAKEPRARLVELTECPPGWTPRKHALRTGMNAASGEILLLTDADCTPPPRWAELFSRPLRLKDAPADVVLGYSPMAPVEGMLGRFQAYETAYTAYRYLGSVAQGQRRMAVGRNMGCTRNLWQRSDQFASHAAVPGGSDDLWLFSLPTHTRIVPLAHPDTRVPTRSQPTFRRWWHQKRRHVSASVRYPAAVKRYFAIGAAAHVLLYAGLLGMACGPLPALAAVMLLGYWVLKAAGMARAGLLAGWPFHFQFPFLDFLYVLYLCIAVPAGFRFRGPWLSNT